MSVYLIDYENVHFQGWEGIEELGPDDMVVLFYSDNASTIPMDLSIRVAQSRAAKQYVKVKKTAKNYLDFQLSALTGYLVATTKQTEFIVVSNDTGYDAVLDFWNTQEFVGRKIVFRRRNRIKEGAVPQAPAGKTAKNTKSAAKSRKSAVQKAAPAAVQNSGKKAAGTKKNAEQKATPAADRNNEAKASAAGSNETSSAKKTVAAKNTVPKRKKAVTDLKQALDEKAEKTKEQARNTKTVKKAAQQSQPDEGSVKKVDRRTSLTGPEKVEARKALNGLGLAPSDYTKVYRLLAKSPDKQAYNIGLVKAFKDQEQGNRIYKATLRLFTQRNADGV